MNFIIYSIVQEKGRERQGGKVRVRESERA